MLTEAAGLSAPAVFTGDVAVPGVAYVTDAWYEVALLSAGIELPNTNGYARAVVPTGAMTIATWTRVTTTATVTMAHAHNLPAGTTELPVPVTDDYLAIPADDYLVTNTGTTTFTFTCLNAGAASGTLAVQLPPFWAVTGTSPDVALTQLAEIVFPAASGGDWEFDELRLIDYGASGTYAFKFVATTPITVVDGNTLTIAAGTLVVNDVSPTLT